MEIQSNPMSLNCNLSWSPHYKEIVLLEYCHSHLPRMPPFVLDTIVKLAERLTFDVLVEVSSSEDCAKSTNILTIT